MQVATCPLSTQVRVHSYVLNRSCEAFIMLRGARVTPMFSQAWGNNHVDFASHGRLYGPSMRYRWLCYYCTRC
jgi:hypothetical protein